jgi:hypothetical protein
VAIKLNLLNANPYLDLFQKYSKLAFWKDAGGSAAGVVTPREKKAI